MFVTYLLRELRRRMRQSIFIALGLALGVGLVITVTAASDGVSATQGTVLNSLYGVGTDVTVTKAPRPARSAEPTSTSAAARPASRRPAAASARHPGWRRPWERSSPRRSPRCRASEDVSAAAGALVLNDVKLSGTFSRQSGAPGGGRGTGSLSGSSFTVDRGRSRPPTRWGRSPPARSPPGTPSPRPSRTRTSPSWTPTTPRPQNLKAGSDDHGRREDLQRRRHRRGRAGRNSADVYIPLARAQALASMPAR